MAAKQAAAKSARHRIDGAYAAARQMPWHCAGVRVALAGGGKARAGIAALALAATAAATNALRRMNASRRATRVSASHLARAAITAKCVRAFHCVLPAHGGGALRSVAAMSIGGENENGGNAGRKDGGIENSA